MRKLSTYFDLKEIYNPKTFLFSLILFYNKVGFFK